MPKISRKHKTKNTRIRAYGVVAVILVLVLTVGISLFSFLQGSMKVNYKQVTFTDPLEFTYPIDKLSVDDSGIKLVAAETSPKPLQVLMLDDIKLAAGERLVSFTQNPQNSDVIFQVSFDPSTWMYYDGIKWKPAGSCSDCGSPADIINQNLGTLPATGDTVRVKAVITAGEITKEVLLHDVTIGVQQIPATPSVLGTSSDDHSSYNDKITICHVPPGNPENAHDITVSENGWNGHDGHDDDFIVDSTHACPPAQAVTPILECVIKNSNYSYTAKFGYNNPNSTATTVAVGSDNYFTPSPSNRSQPTTFQPGRQTEVFTVNFNGSDLKWKLNGSYAVANSSSQRCNIAPNAVNDSASTNRNTAVVIDVLVNDTDPEGALNTNSVVITVAPTHGTAVFSTATRKVTYTPAANYTGSDAFTYKVCDTPGLCDTAVVSITVKVPPNQPPDAVNDTATVVSGSSVVIDVLANDTDPEGGINASSLGVTSNPSHGTFSVSPTTHKITYTPTANYTGTDKFTYKISDAQGLCDSATVTITVTPKPNQPPVANPDSATTLKNTAVVIDVLGNDSDPEGLLSLNSVVVTVAPAHGTTSFNTTTHKITFTPTTNYTGTDTFTYKVCDTAGVCSTAVVTVTITPPPNQPPVANDDTATVQQGSSVEIAVLTNDTDPEGTLDLNSLAVTVPTTHGTYTVGASSHKVIYTPTVTYTGTDTFTYKVCDAAGLCDTALVTITVTARPNQAPVANNDTATTNQNVSVPIAVLSNDNDPEGQLNVNSVQVTQNPSHGSVTINAAHQIVYTPANNYFGTDTFKYKVCDTPGLCDDATVTVTVAKVEHQNQPPVANADSASVPMNGNVIISVLANDNDPEGSLQESSLTVTVAPGHGTAVVNSSTHKIKYTPATGFTGTDTFTYKICDCQGLCSTAVVTVFVMPPANNAPTAVNDSATVAQNSNVVVDVLANDSDVDGNLDPSTLTVTVAPAHGTATVNPTTHKVTYTPTTGYNGSDQFTYRICDTGGLCTTAIVTINVTALNLPPVAVDDSASTLKNTAVDINVLNNDSDPENMLNTSSLSVTVNPAHGTAVVNPTTHKITYTPTTGYTGADTFTYSVCDNASQCDTAIVTVTVMPPANVPPTAHNDTATVAQNSNVVVDVLVNDSDPDGSLDASTLTVTIAPTHGTAVVNPTTHQITYTPTTGYNGNDQFTYQICDNGGLCTTALVTVTVTPPANQPPVAVDDTAVTTANTLVEVNVLSNDTDPEEALNTNSVTITVAPAHGTATVNPTTHKVNYTPATDYVGPDTFTYQVCDTAGLCDTAVVTVTVNPPPNQPPVATDDTATTGQDTAVSITVLANDTDPEGTLDLSTLHVTTANPPAHGTANVNGATHQIVYTPASGYYGTDTFNYEVCDVGGLCDTATVTVTITQAVHVNEAPVANDDNAVTQQDHPTDITVLVNDTDPEGSMNLNSLTVTASPTHGNVVINPDHTITYTPNAGYSGSDSFTYQICDTEGLCDTALVTISVTATPNQAPVAQNDVAVTNQNTAVSIDVLANDNDPEGHLNQNSVTVTAGPTHGAVAVDGGTHQIIYTPNHGYSGADSFSYQVCDDQGLCATALVSVTINPPENVLPVIQNDSAITGQDTPVSIDVLANDSDVDGGLNTETLTITTPPAHGTATVNGTTNQVDYTPSNGYSGSDSLNYQVCDFQGACAIATVLITVTPAPPVNQPPVAQNDVAVTGQDTPVEISVLTNDNDPEGFLNDSSLEIVLAASHGTATINGTTHQVHYVPATGYNGSDSFSYKICDIPGLCAEASVTITITPAPHVNEAPVALDDSASTNQDSAVSVTVLGNDSDPEGSLNLGSLTVTVNPQHGSAVVNNSTHEILYTPSSGFSGTDTFTYQVCDTEGLCDTAVVTINVVALPPVNQPPEAQSDSAITGQDTPVAISVLDNDSDPEGHLNPNSLGIVSGPTHGSTTVDGLTHQVIYTPDAGYHGGDSFTYQICDSDGLCTSASVIISVLEAPPVNQAPVAVDDSGSTQFNTSVIIDVLDNDSDPEGALSPASLSLVTPPNHGTAIIDTLAHTFTYSPELGFSGTDTFTYQVCDTANLCDTAVVTVTVAAKPNLPPEASTDTASTGKDIPVTIPVLVNDSDPDGSLDPTTLTIVTEPNHGSVSIDPLTHEITYTPDPGYVGGDVFVYQICDNSGACDSSSVTVNVLETHVNLPPLAQVDNTITNQDQAVSIPVLNNDTDPEGALDLSSIQLTQLPVHGTAIVNFVTHEIDYTPTSGYSGTDTFKYQVCDAEGLCAEAEVSVTILAAPNMPPTVLSDTGVTNKNVPVNIPVLANDSDADGSIDPTTISIATQPTHGTVSIDPDTHQIVYTPETGYVGGDSFAYTVCDNEGLCGSANVTITISEPPHVNEPPVALPDSATTEEATSVAMSVLVNDSDPEDQLDLASLTVTANPAHGTAVVNPTTHVIIYTPTVGYVGNDTYTYQICDVDGLCASATAFISIQAAPPVNQPPIALDDSAVTFKNQVVDITVLVNDSDPEGSIDLTSLEITNAPTHGTAAFDPISHDVTYTPTADYIGIDSLTYRVCDSNGLCDTANVTITISALPHVNVPPVAQNDTATINQDETAKIAVLLNDSDSDGTLDVTALSITVTPQHGTATVDNATHEVVYTPTSGYSGLDDLIYQICDNDGACTTAAVMININAVEQPNLPPLPQPDEETITEGGETVISVLSNDFDPEGSINGASITITSDPEVGTASVDPVGHAIFYRSPALFTGAVHFSYSICDTPGLCATTTVTVNVIAAPNQPPVATADAVATTVDTPVTIDALDNDNDPEGQLNLSSLSIVTPADHGTATVNPITHVIDYTPASGFTGIDSLIYQICDLQGLCASASVNITVFPAVNQPPVANDDSDIGAFNQPITIPLLTNDNDPDDILQPNLVSLLSLPQHGTGEVDSLTGVFTFVPDAGFVGNDTATYQLCDSHGACDTATIFLTTLSTANIPPLAADDIAQATSNLPQVITVLSNDTDADGVIVPATTTVQIPPTNGVYSIDPITGNITYTSNPDFTGTDTFTYQVCDNNGACDTALVTITVIPTAIIVPPTIVVTPPAEPPVVNNATFAAISINQTQCSQTYTNNSLTFRGTASYTANLVSQLQFTINNGLTWNRVSDEPSFAATSGNYSLNLIEMNSGDYTLQTRAITTNGIAVSNTCNFTIASGLVLGANEFVLANQPSPISDKGVIEFVAGQSQTFYVEGQGATIAEVTNLGTGESHALSYDSKLHLWTGQLVFKEPGVFKLQVRLSNKLGEIKRIINTIFVSPSSSIVDDATGATLNSVSLTIYRRDEDTGNFQIWNSQTFNQQNPVLVSGNLAMTLPNGEYYMTAERDGYGLATSRIFNIDRQGVVSFQIRLQQLTNIFSQLFNTVGLSANNFKIITAVLPEEQKLVVNEALPEVILTAQDQTTTQKLTDLIKGQNTVMIVFSGWNTLAQQQLRIFEQLSAAFEGKFKFIALTTMEPLTASGHYISRGQYPFDIFKPADNIYESYGVNSLPQFVISDKDGKLIDAFAGNKSLSELTAKLQTIN